MNAQLTEIMRLITNLIRTGVVTEVDRENWLCRVKTGELETNWISWLTLRAGNARTWWRPSEGEQVVLLSLGGNLELQYQRSWRHAANSRVNRRPSTQFLGPDNDMLTLSGVLMPEITGGRLSLLALEQMAEQGKAWPLIEGSGTIYGMYVIEGLKQTKTEFFRDGMPRRIEFTLSLKRVDESLSDMFGDLSAQLNNLQGTATSALSDISKTVGGLLS